MYPLFRLVKVSAAGLAGKRLDPLATSSVRFLVWPNDIDTNWHLNNGRYLTLMDLGRWDLALRTGMVRIAVKNRWQPLAGGVTIRFRRPLPPFKSYELTSRILCWDQKWFYAEHLFMQDGRAKARALVRLLFKCQKANVPPSEIVQAMGYNGQPPHIPEEVVHWQEMVEASR